MSRSQSIPGAPAYSSPQVAGGDSPGYARIYNADLTRVHPGDKRLGCKIAFTEALTSFRGLWFKWIVGTVLISGVAWVLGAMAIVGFDVTSEGVVFRVIVSQIVLVAVYSVCVKVALLQLSGHRIKLVYFFRGPGTAIVTVTGFLYGMIVLATSVLLYILPWLLICAPAAAVTERRGTVGRSFRSAWQLGVRDRKKTASQTLLVAVFLLIATFFPLIGVVLVPLAALISVRTYMVWGGFPHYLPGPWVANMTSVNPYETFS